MQARGRTALRQTNSSRQRSVTPPRSRSPLRCAANSDSSREPARETPAYFKEAACAAAFALSMVSVHV
jgi:hypothetical protein